MTLKRALTPSWHPPTIVSSNPNHPPKAPFLNTVMWKVEFQHMDLGGGGGEGDTSIQSIIAGVCLCLGG